MERLQYLKQFKKNKVDFPFLEAAILEKEQAFERAGVLKLKHVIEGNFYQKASHLKFDDAWVEIGRAEELAPDKLQQIRQEAETLIPWRKGPFSLFDMQIDAEWNSHMKWERIKDALSDIQGKRVLDIGCNDGYYMFRMNQFKPQLVMGIDPFLLFHTQFKFLNGFAQCENLQHEVLGVEHISSMPDFFDVILSMGIVYHHRNPISQFQDMFASLRTGGKILVESMGIRGEGSYALFPEDRYAKMRNVWFLPTKDCLYNWMKRTGFKDIELVSESDTELEEQRNTPWCPEDRFQSLEDFLDPQDPSKTIEGHPGPARFAFVGYKR